MINERIPAPDLAEVAQRYRHNLEAALACLQEARDQARALGWISSVTWLRGVIKEVASTGAGPQLRRGKEEEIDAR